MKTTDIICAGSSPSAPAADKAPSDMADAFGAFCYFAAPIEPGARDLFEQAAEARTPAELQAIWHELNSRRIERMGD